MTSHSPAQAAEIHCAGALFDMDGILISSIGSVNRSWTAYCRMRGIAPERALAIVHGVRASDTLRRIRPELADEAEIAAELKIIEDLEVADTEDILVLPGVPELLRALPRDRWTVVTSATERLARVRLAAGGIPVPERIITGDDVKLGKPHPDPYLAGAKLLGVPPEKCVVFEDALSGVKAGRAAGATVVATTFTHPLEALAEAHYRLADLTGISVNATEEGMILSLAPGSLLG
ncbi:HAD-IA family hydrolase [Telmatobacter bradus]|uniref:HAD-IA family hydrolase n=1 Tax=Telmatobacter bradus TaxID=474953 RepID=UPI003B42E56D